MPVAAITGAAQGIGRRTAEVLAERGYSLALIDANPCDETITSVCQLGTPERPLNHVVDLTAAGAISEFARAVQQRWGRADVLVNNAGVSFIRPAEQITGAEFRRVLEVNLVAPFELAQALGAMMLEAATGSIINVASIAGLLGVADRSIYNASKHGLIGLTRTLAAEWGGRGVRCNAVCPGWVKTHMDDTAQGAGLYDDADITGRVPMGRFAYADDIARAIAFLADPVESAFINGHTLVVDGGWTADASWESLRLRHRA